VARCAAVRTSVDARRFAYLTDTTVHRRFAHIERSRGSVSARGLDEDGVQRRQPLPSLGGMWDGHHTIKCWKRERWLREERKSLGRVRHRAEALPQAARRKGKAARRPAEPRTQSGSPGISAAKETPASRSLPRSPSHVPRTDQFPFLHVTAFPPDSGASSTPTRNESCAPVWPWPWVSALRRENRCRRTRGKP
jgi:hypothetical protein